jgi:dipeptidyl aminopeptidase/acylaminoacyl peptidase
MRFAGTALIALLIFTGCADDTEPTSSRTNAVLYTIGLSTDPYGESSPGGFGVATGVANGELEQVEVREGGLGSFGGAEWLDGGVIVVPLPTPPLRRPLIYRYDGELKPRGNAPVPPGANYEWSAEARLFAYEPVTPCKAGQRTTYACYRATGELFVVGADGSSRRRITRGHLMGWTADARIAFFRSYQRATPHAYDLRTRRTGPILPGWKVDLPVWSPDGRYTAALTGNGVRVSRGDGSTVQRIRSKLMISMVAWSPAANRLAFTTSGFPDPHQLFVLDTPSAKPRLLYKTGDMHFDWVTWSPDGEWLLLDEEHHNRWLLLRTDGSGARRTLPRLGGRPLWCCPVNTFRGS